jgi:hypothetical protein
MKGKRVAFVKPTMAACRASWYSEPRLLWTTRKEVSDHSHYASHLLTAGCAHLAWAGGGRGRMGVSPVTVSPAKLRSAAANLSQGETL